VRRDVSTALAAYEGARRPELETPAAGANGSADWHDYFTEHVTLAPVKFVMSYITRSARWTAGAWGNCP
jgi:hypothetical protein